MGISKLIIPSSEMRKGYLQYEEDQEYKRMRKHALESVNKMLKSSLESPYKNPERKVTYQIDRYYVSILHLIVWLAKRYGYDAEIICIRENPNNYASPLVNKVVISW